MIRRMRSRALELASILMLAGGCQSTGTPSPGTPPPSSSQDTLLRCVGGGPGGRAPVVAGTENGFFTAMSRQSIELKPGIEIKSVLGADGKPHTLTLIGRDNSMDMTCGCPGGCAETGESGCVPVVVIGSPVAYCVGDCAKEGACCAGCGWY